MKKISIVSAFVVSSFAYADCEISDKLKNQTCSGEYFLAQNSKQLKEYLDYGKFKAGKLLNLEIGFSIKEGEINVGTSCDIQVRQNVKMWSRQNGICIQGKNVFFNKNSKLHADKKAPISIIANNSIKIRKTKIQTSGEINIISKTFDPFSNEILISKDSYISSDKLKISSLSSLIINADSKIKSSDVVLNGGNCEVGEGDDQENDKGRIHEKNCSKFQPKFSYTGTCLNNPIPTTLKISSEVDKDDSLKLSFTLKGADSDSIKWKFDDEFENSGKNVIHSYSFPGKHFAEVVISNSNGYFRKLGSYHNVSPNKFNVGQLSIFHFQGISNGPSKVTALIGKKSFSLFKSLNDSRVYYGEIPSETFGIKLITIPEFGYKANFNLVVLPTINNPGNYINTFIDSIDISLKEMVQTDQVDSTLVTSLSDILFELKSKINSLSVKDKSALAAKIQANIEGLSKTITQSNKLDFKFNLLHFLIPSAQAQGLSFADKFIPPRMKEYTVSDIIEVGAGITWVTTGTLLLKAPSSILLDKIAGGLLISLGVFTIIKYHGKKNKIINDLWDFIGKIALSPVSAGETHTIRISGEFIPVSASSTNSLAVKARNQTNEYNNMIKPLNDSIANINSILDSVGFSKKIVGSIPTLVFPAKTFQSSLSSDFITDFQLLNSEFGDVSIKSAIKIEDGVAFQFNAERSQNATVRIFYKNDDFNVYVYKDVVVKIVVNNPKAIINYTKNNLVVHFDSTDPQDPDITNLNYIWDFGDGQTITTGSKTFSHSYPASGNYNVTLIVADAYGNQDLTTATIQVQSESEVVCEDSTITFGVIQEDLTGNDGVVFDCGGSCDENKVFVKFPVIPFKGSSFIFYDLSRTKFLLVDRYFSWRGHTGMTYPVSVCHTRNSSVNWYSTNAGSTVCSWGVVPCN